MIIGKEYVDNLDNKILTNRLLWFVVLFMILIYTLLLYSYFELKNTQAVKIVLPSSEVATIQNNRADAIYYQFFAEKMNEVAANFTPDNVNGKVKYLEGFFLPSVHQKYETQILAFKEGVIKNRLTQNFVPERGRIEAKSLDDGRAANIVIPGIAHQKVGDSKKKIECSYSYKIVRNGGNDYVASFKTDCF